MTQRNTLSRCAKGFTIIELLAVIAIISILMALIGGVGLSVIKSRQDAVTQSVLVALNRALEEYIGQVGGSIPPYDPMDYDKTPGDGYTFTNFPLYPTSGGQRNPARPDAAVFIRQALGTGEVQSIIGSIPDRFLIVTQNNTSDNDRTPSIVDYWANKNWPDDRMGNKWDIAAQQIIYYIHPDNQLAQDLYGQCLNRRPYFMSAGRDGKYGLGSEFGNAATQDDVEAALDDNLYSYAPGEPNRDAGFFNSYRRTQ